MPYGDQWRRHRRWFQKNLLTRNTLKTYESLQNEKARLLIKEMIETPENTLTHLKRWAPHLSFGFSA